MANNPKQSTDRCVEEFTAVDNARVKLLTLLNVISAKPHNPSKRRRSLERDWAALARPSVGPSTCSKPMSPSSDQNISKKLPTDSHTMNLDDVPTSDKHVSENHSSSIDMYSYHFGPNTVLSNPEQMEAVKHCSNWKMVSNKRSDGKRAVRYLIDPAPKAPPESTSFSSSIPAILKDVVTKLTPRQVQVLKDLETYEDIWYSNVPYTPARADFCSAVSLWALQHVLKTRAQILKNNKHIARLSQPAKTSQPDSLGSEPTKVNCDSEITDTDIRDQGFTRPKVLVLLPFRSSARNWINTLLSLTPSSLSAVAGLERFEKEYTLPVGTVDKLESDDAQLKYTLEHRMIFSGNVDDDFKLGIKFNRKEVKLYSDFYQSDIIVGSPVGLRKLIEKEGDADFLSSIEITVVDQMDVMLMQNWDHVEFIFDHINQIPSKPRDTDFSRVKPWYLDHHARSLRQTIMLSSLTSPEQNGLFRKLTNVAGKVTHFNQPAALKSGVLWKIRKGLLQTWHKFDFDQDPQLEEGFRFQHFKDKILNNLEQSALVKAGLGGIMIFVPNYFDFVKLEDHMRSMDDVRYMAISEYSSPSEITAARSAFYNHHVSYLLVTERFHFYHRYKLRGAKTIIFYAPPIHPDYYVEFCNEYPFDKGNVGVEEVKVQVLFSNLDQDRIERIAGIEDCQKMVKGDGTKFTFI